MNSSEKPIISPYLGIFIGILAVSSASIFIKFAQREVSSIVIASYRLAISTIILAPIAIVKHRNQFAKITREELGLAILSGVLLAIHFGTWIKSLEFTTVASSVVLVTTTPLWVAIMSPFTIKERVNRSVILGMILALGGTVIIGVSDYCSTPDGFFCPSLSGFYAGEAFLGDFLALTGAWSAAGYVLIGRKLRKNLKLTPYIFLVYGIAAAVLILVVIVSGRTYFGFEPQTYFLLLLLALIPQLIGHSSFNWALGFLPAAFVAVSLLGEPIGSSILAYVFLEEIPGLLQVVGAVFIFGGILIASNTREQSSIRKKSGTIDL